MSKLEEVERLPPKLPLGKQIAEIREQLEGLPILAMQTQIEQLQQQIELLKQAQTRSDSSMQSLANRAGQEVKAMKQTLASLDSRLNAVTSHLRQGWRRLLPLPPAGGRK